MKKRRTNSFLILFTILAIPLIVCNNVRGSDSTADWYEILGSTPDLLLTDTTIGDDTNWRIRVDYPRDQSFHIQRIVGSSYWWPFVIEPGTPNNLLFLDASGLIGINTSMPEEELHIMSPQPVIRLEDTGSGSGYVDLDMNLHELAIQGESDQEVVEIDTRAPEHSLTLDSTGQIGVGTLYPTAPLHVDAESLTLGLGNSVVLLQNDGPLAFQLDNTLIDGFWNFANANGESEFRISRSDTGQTELVLSEEGDLTITGTLMAGNPPDTFPDYVFESDYELMPLTKLASFIEKEKHLPEIPNAEEVEQAGGINISMLQLQLLKKIEELTLYTLNQQKAIDKQQELIHELKEQIAVIRQTQDIGEQ